MVWTVDGEAADAKFDATIVMVDGVPKVTWSPDFGAERIYWGLRREGGGGAAGVRALPVGAGDGGGEGEFLGRNGESAGRFHLFWRQLLEFWRQNIEFGRQNSV